MLSGGPGGLGSAIYGGAKAAAWAKDKVSIALAKEHNAQYAKYALPTEGLSRDELIRNLEAVANKPKRSLLSKTHGLARLVGP